MPERRTRFDQEFKVSAVRLVEESGRPIPQVARDLGVHEGTLWNWVAKARAAGDPGGLRPDEREELEPLGRFADTLETHWDGVINWHSSQVGNGLIEGRTSLVQAAKRRARGYRSARTYKAMICLVAGKLNTGPQIA